MYDFTSFWDKDPKKNIGYRQRRFMEFDIVDIATEFGYHLPEGYIAMMRHSQNGGTPVNTCFPTQEPNSWADDHIKISCILGVDTRANNSINGAMGTKHYIREWGYPAIGLLLCPCPNTGHCSVWLNYRDADDMYPTVILVDQSDGYKITHLADCFTDFIEGLQPASKFK